MSPVKDVHVASRAVQSVTIGGTWNLGICLGKADSAAVHDRAWLATDAASVPRLTKHVLMVGADGLVDYWVTRDATVNDRIAGDDPAMREPTPGSGSGQVPVARR